MIKNNLIIFFLISAVYPPLFAQDISIDSQFDRGSIGSLKQVSENHFRGQTMHWIKKDKIGNQYYWFYFRVSGVKRKTLSFELDNLTGVYRGGPHIVYSDYTQPVISYDQEHWRRITDVDYNEENDSFTFNVSMEKKTAWIAYAHPYPYHRYKNYVNKVLNNPYVKMSAEGASPENRPVKILRITDEESNQAKKSVFIQAMQHAGEDAGGYFTEGLVNYLISEDPRAAEIRKRIIFYIVPLMNPDGTFQGCSRYNTDMEDLNSEWDDDLSDASNFPVEPEVQFIKNWIRHFYQDGGKIDLFIDIHNHTQFNTEHIVIGKGSQLGQLTRLTSQYWPLGHRDAFENPGSATWFFSTQYNVLAGTLELSQSYVVKSHYLDITDYRQYGEDFVKAIDQFFQQ